MKYLLPLTMLAACSTPALRTPKIEPLTSHRYAFDVTAAELAAPPIVLRLDRVAADAPLEAIRTLVAPESWSRGALFVENNQLVIRNAPAVCERVKQVLAAIDGQKDQLVAVTARFLKLSREQVSDLRNLEPANGSLAGLFDRAALADIVSGWMEEGAQIVSTPRCTAFHGQHAHVSVTTQISYIEGYERAEGGSYDPVISVITDGLSLRTVAVRVGDRLQLATSIELSSLLPTKLINISFEDRIVQLPAAAKVSAEQRISVARNQSLLLMVRNPDSRDEVHPLLAVVIDAD